MSSELTSGKNLYFIGYSHVIVLIPELPLSTNPTPNIEVESLEFLVNPRIQDLMNLKTIIKGAFKRLMT